MSNNFDKIVKLACKPKNAPPKAKYVDTLVAATYSDDGSLNDITRSLSLRLREPNAVVVFKALIVLHQMMRSGSSDQLLEHLAQNDVLRLRNVSGQNWEGYSPPSNMGAYASYLDSRIRAWRDVKHDLVRAQAESNRRSDGLSAGSKARRLRHLPVEKGLLREVKQVQRVLDSLIMCKFFDDDLKDENTVLAFRMLVKDLLVLFQAGNEGVCNILEHYFEMSKVDATESFDIYKSFIKQTDKVVDYLGVARKLHNIVNVPVPNLKHAPTSLVKALEEYLNDPNFEQNRMEYKKSLGIVEGKGTARTPSPNPPAQSESAKTAAPTPAPAPASSSSAPAAPPGASKNIQDFFDSIQAEQQPTMFGGPAQPFPQHLQQQMQVPFNPFRQSMMMPQQTGFMQPHMTGFSGGQMPFVPPNQTGINFAQPQPLVQQPFQPSQPFMQAQPTGFIQPQPQLQQPQQTGFLQPQTTGANPFRQSMMLNTTSSPSGIMSQPASPFQAGGHSQIQRPGSTPAFSSVKEAQPLVAQGTGKNPFAPAGGVPQPKKEEPKGPSMNDLAWNRMYGGQQTQPGATANLPGNTGAGGASPWTSGGGDTKSTHANGSGIADIASSFLFDNKASSPTTSGTSDFLSQFGSLGQPGSTNPSSPPPSQFGSVSSNPTGTSAFGSLSSQSTGANLTPQKTGWGGSTVKRFQPTSSFGSQLLESLPSIPEPSPSATTPSANPNGGNGIQTQQTGFPGFGTGTSTGPTFGSPSPLPQSQQNQHTGLPQPNSFGQLQQQNTGLPNPFRQSMFNSLGSQPTGAGGFGASGLGNGAFGSSSPVAGQNNNTNTQGQQPFSGQSSTSVFGGGQQQQQPFGGGQQQHQQHQQQQQQPFGSGQQQPFGGGQQ
ncbi:ANTH domain-domain-containing protein, partial [Naematelia encephala]